jgi:hypothetical protein
MKDNFEHIKKLVENFEVEYNPQAWESLSKKLDQTPTPTAKTKFGKYIWTSAAVTAIAVSTAIYFTMDETSKAVTKSSILKNETKDEVQNTSQASNNQANSNTSPNHLIVENNTNESLDQDLINNKTEGDRLIPITHVNEGHDKHANNILNVDKSLTGNPIPSIKIPHIKNTCVNETIQIKNENNTVLYVQHGNDRVAQIEANKTLNLELKHIGEYTISGSEFGQGFAESFMVYSTPKTNFNYSDEINYESGLPILSASTEDVAQSYEWKVDGKTIGNQKTVSFPAFYKGELNVTLETSNQNGCKNTESKKIEIEENYNLLAVNAFEPNNANPKRNSFMPYALTKREVKFNLIIIDPTSGAVVFESSDPTNPWTGVNKNTGQMMSNNKSYIWKVTILQPSKGEKTEYKGMITLL